MMQQAISARTRQTYPLPSTSPCAAMRRQPGIPNLFRLMQIDQEISQLLAVPVTITTRNALNPLDEK
jgi:hypothetical protein